MQRAASFLGMWLVMMIAMMLPSLAPVLWRYREVLGHMSVRHRSVLASLVGLAYFAIWTAFGMAAFAAGVALAALEMQWPALARAIPAATCGVILGAGVLQFTAWNAKARHLACCRSVSAYSVVSLTTNAHAACRYGLRLGLSCGCCCAGLTAILLAVGVMDLRAMGAVAAAVTLERLAPTSERVARATGVVAVGYGVLLIVRILLAH